MVLGTAARHRSARPLDICPPSSLTPLCLRWSQVARRSHFEWLADRVHVSLLPCSLQVSSVDGLPRQQVHTSSLHLQRPSVLSLGKDRARVRRATPTCRAASGAASQALELLNPFFVSRSQHGSGNRYPAHVPLNVRCRGDLRAERRWGRCLRGWERCDLFHTGLAPWWEATQLAGWWRSVTSLGHPSCSVSSAASTGALLAFKPRTHCPCLVHAPALSVPA